MSVLCRHIWVKENVYHISWRVGAMKKSWSRVSRMEIRMEVERHTQALVLLHFCLQFTPSLAKTNLKVLLGKAINALHILQHG